MSFLTHSQVQRIDYAKITGVGMHAATCNIYWVFGDRKRFYTCFNPGGQNLPYTLFFDLQGGCILMNGCDDYTLEERVAMYLEARDRLIEADFALHTRLGGRQDSRAHEINAGARRAQTVGAAAAAH